MPTIIMSDLVADKHKHGEGHARRIAAESIAFIRDNPDSTFNCLFPHSMLDLVPADFHIAAVGRHCQEQRIDEAAFWISYPKASYPKAVR